MYVTVRKYRVRQPYAEVVEAVTSGLVPILRTAPGFKGHWVLDCNDGDVAAISIFDTKANAEEAIHRTLAWVQAHARELLILPPEVMFGASVEQVAGSVVP